MNKKSYECLFHDLYTYEDISIKTIEPDFIEKIRGWRNAQLHLLRQINKITKEEQSTYYEKNIWNDMGKTPKNILFGIFNKSTLIGYGGLVRISWHDKRAEVSFLIDTAFSHYEHCEILQKFIKLIKQVAFDGLGINKLWTETYDLRTYHIQTLEDSGFKLEGILKEHNIIDNSYCDSLIHGFTQKDRKG